MSNELDLVSAMGQGRDTGRKFGNAVVAVLQVLMRPVMLTTRVLTRSRFGERFFSTPQAVLAVALVLLACLMTETVGAKGGSGRAAESSYDSLFGRAPSASSKSGTEESSHVGLILGLLWSGAIVAAAVEHRVIVSRRLNRAERWHSYSPGTPRLDTLQPWLEHTVFLGLAAVLWWFGAYAFAVLLAASDLFTAMQEHQAKQALWNRVLDTLDAQIEGEHLQKAIEGRATPQDTEGLMARLPSYVPAPFRRRIGEAIGPGRQVAGQVELKPRGALEAADPTA